MLIDTHRRSMALTRALKVAVLGEAPLLCLRSKSTEQRHLTLFKISTRPTKSMLVEVKISHHLTTSTRWFRRSIRRSQSLRLPEPASEKIFKICQLQIKIRTNKMVQQRMKMRRTLTRQRTQTRKATRLIGMISRRCRMTQAFSTYMVSLTHFRRDLCSC